VRLGRVRGVARRLVAGARRVPEGLFGVLQRLLGGPPCLLAFESGLLLFATPCLGLGLLVALRAASIGLLRRCLAWCRTRCRGALVVATGGTPSPA